MRSVIPAILLTLVFVPGWTGDPRMPQYEGEPRVTYSRVALDRDDPSRHRVGALTYLGGLRLRSDDSAFGGFSAMHVAGERFMLLADGGLGYAFTMGRDLVPRDGRSWELPDGPRGGWARMDRDAESLAVDPVSGRMWIGFENANAIWRYSPGLKRPEAHRAPRAMRKWPLNGGPEAIVRLQSGRFLVFAESKLAGPGARMTLSFDRDPTDPGARGFAFAYRPPTGYSPTDAAELPDGRLLMLNRRFSLREGFTAVITLVDARRIKPRAMVKGREIARFASPLVHDNFEALAITQEGADTILWIASDDNTPSYFQRSLLLKFRLDLQRRR